MSQYGFTGGYRRPKRPERGDPAGPPIEEIERQYRQRILKGQEKNFDTRFGGPVFQRTKHQRLNFFQRNHVAFSIIGCAIVFMGMISGPVYQSYHRPELTEEEKEDIRVFNDRWEKKFGDKFYKGLIPRFASVDEPKETKPPGP